MLGKKKCIHLVMGVHFLRLLCCFCSFLLTLKTFLCFPSELCYQVLGNAKGAVAVVISILLFRNPVTAVGIGGYTVTVSGVIAYGEAKRRFR